MDVLERIQQLKQTRGWSDYRLSVESGVAQTTISSWFHKQAVPSVISLQNICDAFQITLSEFFSSGSEAVVLTPPQRQLLDAFSVLNAGQQTALLQFLKSMEKPQ
ncbi:MAG: helix-turn-helix transcriptional regulator [Oscillospiraceae bacterium]|nr:helix-turn-helix transcriptional regulator [Oscillospiraceae bacterium]